MLVLLQGEPETLAWSRVGTELLGFLGSYALYGAVGARLVAPRLTARGAEAPGWAADGARGVAGIGIGGALLSLATILISTASRAAERHVSVGAALAAGGSRLTIQLGLFAAALLGFVLARARVGAGWALAGAAAVALAVRGLVPNMQWASLVNPLHVLAGGLWLGTLGVLVVVLFPRLLRGGTGADAGLGGSRLDALVRRFSRLALVSSALLGVTGVITAWRHLGAVDALWTTPYGWMLDAKLVVVLAIVGLGFYNWRYATPALGAGAGDAMLVRSSRREVALGALVLAMTAVLVSLPAPAEERRPGGPPGAGAAPRPERGPSAQPAGAPTAGPPAPGAH